MQCRLAGPPARAAGDYNAAHRGTGDCSVAFAYNTNSPRRARPRPVDGTGRGGTGRTERPEPVARVTSVHTAPSRRVQTAGDGVLRAECGAHRSAESTAQSLLHGSPCSCSCNSTPHYRNLALFPAIRLISVKILTFLQIIRYFVRWDMILGAIRNKYFYP